MRHHRYGTTIRRQVAVTSAIPWRERRMGHALLPADDGIGLQRLMRKRYPLLECECQILASTTVALRLIWPASRSSGTTSDSVRLCENPLNTREVS